MLLYVWFRHGCEMENYLPYDQAPHIYKSTFSLFIYTYYHLHEGEKLLLTESHWYIAHIIQGIIDLVAFAIDEYGLAIIFSLHIGKH